jgi:hypothetical protein
MAKVSEAYQRPEAVQWASATALQEKEAVMMAVTVTHCARHQWLGFMGTAFLVPRVTTYRDGNKLHFMDFPGPPSSK